MTSDALFESNLRSLALIHRGKVRDIYGVGFKTADRIARASPGFVMTGSGTNGNDPSFPVSSRIASKMRAGST